VSSFRVVHSGATPCIACGTPVKPDQTCVRCIVTAAKAELDHTPAKKRAAPVRGMPRLKGDGLRVLDLETGELKYRVPQKVAHARARDTIRGGARREWGGKP
jgi:hypothetical protein